MTLLTFSAPPYGLGPATRFELEPVDGAQGLCTLTSIDDGLRIFLLDAGAHLADYRPIIPNFDLAALGASADAIRVFVVVNPSGERTTVNLAAPVLVAPDGVARQVILEGSVWPLRSPLAELLAHA
jgi:flagellar assembly factor FliW